MTFYSRPVPNFLRADSFLLRPLRASDNALDYEAMCDRWETQAWLEKGYAFTPQMNLSALRDHERQHQAREAFTYTIMNPAQNLCLGCMYIRPLMPLLREAGASTASLEAMTAQDAAVRFWLRDSYRKGDWDKRVLQTILKWLDQEWKFPQIALHTNIDDARQRRLFENHHFQLFCLLDFIYGAFYKRLDQGHAG